MGVRNCFSHPESCIIISYHLHSAIRTNVRRYLTLSIAVRLICIPTMLSGMYTRFMLPSSSEFSSFSLIYHIIMFRSSSAVLQYMARWWTGPYFSSHLRKQSATSATLLHYAVRCLYGRKSESENVTSALNL